MEVGGPRVRRKHTDVSGQHGDATGQHGVVRRKHAGQAGSAGGGVAGGVGGGGDDGAGEGVQGAGRQQFLLGLVEERQVGVDVLAGGGQQQPGHQVDVRAAAQGVQVAQLV